MEGEEEMEEEESAYPIDPEQLEPQTNDETDEKYDRAMSILKGMIEMGDSGFSSSSIPPPVKHLLLQTCHNLILQPCQPCPLYP